MQVGDIRICFSALFFALALTQAPSKLPHNWKWGGTAQLHWKLKAGQSWHALQAQVVLAYHGLSRSNVYPSLIIVPSLSLHPCWLFRLFVLHFAFSRASHLLCCVLFWFPSDSTLHPELFPNIARHQLACVLILRVLVVSSGAPGQVLCRSSWTIFAGIMQYLAQLLESLWISFNLLESPDAYLPFGTYVHPSIHPSC